MSTRESETKVAEVIQGLVGDLWAIEPHLSSLHPSVSKAVDTWMDATVAVLDEISHVQYVDLARERNASVMAYLAELEKGECLQ